MKKLSVFFICLLLSSSQAISATKSKVLATCSGDDITEAQVSEKFKEMAGMRADFKDKKFTDLEPDMQIALVDNYINEKLITKAANKSKLHTTKDFKKRVENFSKQLMVREFMEKIVKEKVTEEMVDKEYQKLTNSLKNKKEVKAAHILVEDEKNAKDLRKKITRGKDFGEIARTHSKDPGSKLAGGELGYFLEGQMVPEFEKKAFSMKVGEVSEPVKTQFGWHIIKVLDKRAARAPSKKEAHQGIFNKLASAAIEDYLQELRKNNKVKVKIKK